MNTAHARAGQALTYWLETPRTPKASDEGTKTAAVIALLERTNGATLTELMQSTGWQANSVRSFISGILRKRKRLCVDSAERPDGERYYSLKR